MIELFLCLTRRAGIELAKKKAYKSWIDQRQRCNNPNDPGYKHWGAKGIVVEYSSKEFVEWYVKEYQKRESWVRPNVGRINHSKNYTLDNIELVECSDNVKERNKRLGNPQKSKPISFKNLETGEIKTFSSKREAARILGISRQLIRHQCNNELKRAPTSGWKVLK